jgi:hypothetical protein
MLAEHARQRCTQSNRRARRTAGLGKARRILVAIAAACACALAAPQAAAFCRTTTCPFPPAFIPIGGECNPPDFEQLCALMDPPVKNLPVFWKNACISYDINAAASRQVPYNKAVELFAIAFGKWTGTTCTTPQRGRVSIDVKNLGPVACDQVQYNSDQGNQHVIIFYDSDWPYAEDTANTLGLTTITFDPDTGEIYDADMAIKSTPDIPLSISDPVPPDGYDLLSIITHEAGHFLGLAHSPDPNATMYASYDAGSTNKRTLSSDDTGAICSVYLPGGNRSVDPSVADGGLLPEGPCDPTPRHGWQSVCAEPMGCDVGWSSARTGRGLAALVAGVVAMAAARARRRPRSGRSPGVAA